MSRILPAMKPRKREQSPLIGFGLAGYIAAAVLIAIIVSMAMGVDLQYQLLRLITATFGVDVMIDFVVKLFGPWFAIFGPTISVLTGVFGLLAFQISPYRLRLVNQLAWFSLCVVFPFVWSRITGKPSSCLGSTLCLGYRKE